MTLICDASGGGGGGGDDPIPTRSMSTATKRKHVVSKKQRPKSKKSRQSLSNNMTQIESEFKVLQSLIPPIAFRQQLTELEIIDACVSYIENLQSQLMLKPEDSESFAAGYCQQMPDCECGGHNHNHDHNHRQLPALKRIVNTDCNGNLEAESE